MRPNPSDLHAIAAAMALLIGPVLPAGAEPGHGRGSLGLELTPELRARLPADLPATFIDRLAAAARDCRQLAEGALGLGLDAIARPDLDGDGRPDWVLEESALTCAGARGWLCGSGGCISAMVIDDEASELFSNGWFLIERPGQRPLLRAIVGGLECGQSQSEGCQHDMEWWPGGWRALGPAMPLVPHATDSLDMAADPPEDQPPAP